MESRGLTAAMLAVLLLCFVTPVAFSAGTQEAAGGDDEQVTITWGMWAATDTEVAQWQELADDVTERYPHITVRLETTGWNPYWTRMQTQIASDTLPDVVGMQSLRAYGYYSLGGFRSLTPFIANDAEIDMGDYDPFMIEALSYGGEIYGLPYDAGPRVLFYNIDLFEARGVEPPDGDTTWEEWVEIAGALTDGDTYGFAAVAIIDEALSWIASAGGRYFDTETERYDLTDPGTEVGLQFFADLMNRYRVVRPIDDPGNGDFAREQFYTGTIGMINDGPWQATNIRANADFRVGMAPLPVGPAGRRTPIAGSGFAMSAATEHPEEAYLVIKSLTGSESLSKLARWGRGFPARRSAVESFYAGQEAMEGLSWIEESLPHSFAQLGPQHYQEFQNVFNQELEALLLGLTDDAGAVLREITRRANAFTDVRAF